VTILVKKKFEKYKHEKERALSFVYQDKIQTLDLDKRGEIITIRNRITGETTTLKKGTCREEIIYLHAAIVSAKWQRPTEGEILGKLIKP
jgi:hypothetical protein